MSLNHFAANILEVTGVFESFCSKYTCDDCAGVFETHVQVAKTRKLNNKAQRRQLFKNSNGDDQETQNLLISKSEYGKGGGEVLKFLSSMNDLIKFLTTTHNNKTFERC